MRFAVCVQELWLSLFGGNAWVKAVAAWLGASVAYVLPTQAVRDTAIACALFMALDTATGTMSAIKQGLPLSSAKFSRVLSKIIAYTSVVSVASIATKFLPGLIEYRPVAIATVLYLILATEGISILENAGKLGVKLPKGLVKWLRGKLEDEQSDLVAPSAQGETP